MSYLEWPEVMPVLEKDDIAHFVYGLDGSCDTPHCAHGWVTTVFGEQHYNWWQGLDNGIGDFDKSPMAIFVSRLIKECGNAPIKDDGGTTLSTMQRLEYRFEGWKRRLRKMSASKFADAWNRTVSYFGYDEIVDRP